MIQQSSVSEDFTFPKLAHEGTPPYLGFPSFTASSLWNCSRVSSEHDHDVGGETQEQKSLFSARDGKGEALSPRDMDFYSNGYFDDPEVSSVDGEEKMDMLWEDFNDELGRLPFWCGKEVGKRNGTLKDWAINVEKLETDVDSAPKTAHVGRANSLKVSKSGCMLPHRRPSLLVILKVLKKLFLLHHSYSPKRR